MAACIACGVRLGREARFCQRCGVAQPANRARSSNADPAMERRHLTVLFCDLAGSTALSAALEPELLADVIMGYRQAMQAEIAKAGGTVARYLGDGILAYFGYPAADEDDPVHAVRAALAMLRALPRLNDSLGHVLPEPLAVRIGVHTGLVLIEQGGLTLRLMSAGAIGRAPNIAARLQELAPPGTALVSNATYNLTALRFEYSHGGAMTLKGIAEPVDVYRPLQERMLSRRRFAKPLPDVVGRENEMARLQALWRATCQDGGTRVLVTGEAGIGKTHLVNWMMAEAGGQRGLTLSFLCHSDTAQSPFRAVIAGLQRHLPLGSGPPAEQVQRLRRIINRSGMQAAPLLRLLCQFLSLPTQDTGPDPVLTLEGRNRLLLDLLLEWLERISERRPVLLLVENVHWADPSTQDWLARLVRRTGPARIMVMMTSRPQPLPGWHAGPQLVQLVLERLNPVALFRILDNLMTGHSMDLATRCAILDRSDGVPLFLEQLFKNVAEGGDVEPKSETTHALPASLQGMLAARLDRLGSAKKVAQAASVIGRQFSLALLRALRPTATGKLEADVAALVEAEIVQLIHASSGDLYAFKHALLRDAAYDSLLLRERRTYHARLVRAYPKLAPRVADEQPEIVAHHASEAELTSSAAALWRRAGARAFERSAYREAATHFRRGLAEAERLRTPAAMRQVAQFYASLAATAIATEGFAAPEVERFSIQACELCSRMPNPAELDGAIGGLTTYYQVRGPLHRARDLTLQLLRRAERRGDDTAVIRARRRLGWCLFCIGEIAEGRRILTDALHRYGARHRTERLHDREIDAGVIGYANLGWVESFCGNPERALVRCEAGLELARTLGERPMDMAYALCMSAATHQVLGDHAATLHAARQANALAERNALPYWRAWSQVLLGWAEAKEAPAQGTRSMLRGLAMYRSTGARLFVPYCLGLIAEVTPALNRGRTGLLFVEHALSASAEVGAHFNDARLLLIRARLLTGTGLCAEVDATLAEAIALAERQGARTAGRVAAVMREAKICA